MPTLHSLPFHIDYDGEAHVSKGFPITADEYDSSKFTATFRGRRLTGTAVALPSDLQICQFGRNGESLSVLATFRGDEIKIFEWNKEDAPEKPKLSFASFSRFVNLQAKFNDLFTQ